MKRREFLFCSAGGVLLAPRALALGHHSGSLLGHSASVLGPRPLVRRGLSHPWATGGLPLLAPRLRPPGPLRPPGALPPPRSANLLNSLLSGS